MPGEWGSAIVDLDDVAVSPGVGRDDSQTDADSDASATTSDDDDDGGRVSQLRHTTSAPLPHEVRVRAASAARALSTWKALRAKRASSHGRVGPSDAATVAVRDSPPKGADLATTHIESPWM